MDGKYVLQSAGRLANLLELGGIFIMLCLAFSFQILFHELPCPLCLLQRVGFLCVALGFLMNLRFGPKPSHYAIALLSAIYTSFVALRQIALHVVPGTGTYGNAIFGMHLYTWSFIISMMIIIFTTIVMGIDRQYLQENAARQPSKWSHVLFMLMVLLICSNLVSVILECGFKECPDNPTQYYL